MDRYSLKREIVNMKYDLELVQKADCTPEENVEFTKLYNTQQELPADVFKYQNGEGFYRVITPLSSAEEQEYLALKQCKMIKTIRNCVIFFTVLTVLALALSLLALS